jgi:activator of HSP90 ATPase
VPTIKHIVIIPDATHLEVFRALTSSKIHSKVTGSPARVNARVGGKFTAWDGYISGKNLKLVKGKKIVQEWRTTEWPSESTPSSILDISLKQTAKGTELRMVHSKIPSKELARNYDAGWYESYWNPMKRYFKKAKR